MTKKHFIMLADELKRCEPINSGDDVHRAWSNAVHAVANACEQANPLFKRQMFIDYVRGACGKSGGKVKQVVNA